MDLKDSATLPADLHKALSTGHEDLSEKSIAIREAFDSMFYAYDRLRSAVEGDLIERDDLSGATIYYASKLVTSHRYVLDYGRQYAYPRAADFIESLGGSAGESQQSRKDPPCPFPGSRY